MTNDDFYGLDYIKLNDELFEISEDVVVYNKKTDQVYGEGSISFARQNFKEFSIYTCNSLQSEQIRVIIVE